MADDPSNLVLEHLRAIRSDVHEIKTVQREHGHRLTRLEIGVAALRRDQASEVIGWRRDGGQRGLAGGQDAIDDAHT